MNRLDPATTALIVIDVQKAFDQVEAERQRNNPQALDRIVDLLALFRAARAPIFHIRHAGQTLASRFHPALPGHQVKDEAREWPGEAVLVCVYTQGGAPTPERLTAVFGDIGRWVGQTLG